MHVTDPKYMPIRLSKIHVYKIFINNTSHLCFHWGCEVPASMKSQKYATKVCLPADGKLHCCNCNCKVSSKDEDESNPINDDVKNMTCTHTCPCMLKVTFMLCDFLAEDI